MSDLPTTCQKVPQAQPRELPHSPKVGKVRQVSLIGSFMKKTDFVYKLIES